jgi:hypothetical protein
MRNFKDRNGKEWTLEVNGFTLERVEASCGVYLPGLFDDGGKSLGRFLEDDRKVRAAVWELCREQAEKDGLAHDDLKRTWFGDYADAATDALLGELVDFFPDPKRRTALRKGLEKLKTLGYAILDKAEGKADAITPEEIDAAAESAVEILTKYSVMRSSGSSGNSAANSDSIPARSPSATS